MSDQIFLKDYENTISHFNCKNNTSKKTGTESNKKIENIQNKLNNKKKIIFKVEHPKNNNSSHEEKESQKKIETEKNVNNINNINNFLQENDNLSLNLFLDYNMHYQDGENELNKEFEVLERSSLFVNIGSNNASFNRNFIQNDNNNINQTENNVINHSNSENDGDVNFQTKTIIVGNGLSKNNNDIN